MLQEKAIVTSQIVSVLSSVFLKPELSHAQELSALYKKYIPSVIARRCSVAVKMALTVASKAMENHAVDYAVFCSEHGELQCGVSLLSDLSKKELLSPADFSRSVHNTASGIFSIIHKMHQNMTSIAAGRNTFLAGCFSALTWLQTHPNSQVLLTAFDDHIPEEYCSLNIARDQQYAAAFLLSNKADNEKKFSVNIAHDLTQSNDAVSDALLFYQWLNSAEEKFLMPGDSPTKLAWTRVFV